MTKPGVMARINASRKPTFYVPRSLNKYIVSENGVSFQVTARNEKVALAIAVARHAEISPNASLEFVDVYNYQMAV